MKLSEAASDMVARTFRHLRFHHNAAPMVTLSMLHRETFSQMILWTSAHSAMFISTMGLLMNNKVLPVKDMSFL